jgi:predicted acyltransferase
MDATTRLPVNVGTDRNLAIDRFRGALVILMVIGDYLGGIEFVPSQLKHAPDIGFTIADTVAPAFIFVIGLNFGPSFARRLSDGAGSAYRYFALRYLAIVGIGSVISAGATMVGQPTDWGVLQAIGIAGLSTLLVIRLPTWVRFAIGILVLVGYQYLLDTAMLGVVLPAVHGGLFGAVSWGGLLILSTAVADLWRRGITAYIACVVTLAALAVLSAVIVPISKHRVSLSFDLITLALSALVFLIIERISRVTAKRPGVFCWWGQSALALYLIHLLILGVVVTPPWPWWYTQAPVWLAVVQLTVILVAMTLIALWMLKRRVRRMGSTAV